MKILYVEDELSKNIPRIIRLFSNYLSKKQRKSLESLIENETGFRIDPQEVKGIIEDAPIIEVEWRFPDALRKIIQPAKKYDLFIIDRNLSEQDYEYEELKNIDPLYNKTLYNDFFEREGDYFLHKLIYDIDVVNKFYFLTAYSASDELRNGEDIKRFIDFGKFTDTNFIEKGNESHIKRLQDIMKSSNSIELRNANQLYLGILSKYLGEEADNNFFKIIKEKGSYESIVDNLMRMRNIYEQILRECVRRIPDMKANCLNERGDIILSGQTIEWLKSNQHISNMQRDFFFSIVKNTSDQGNHRKLEESKPTIEAINALIYQLKDITLWFGKICEKYSNKILSS